MRPISKTQNGVVLPLVAVGLLIMVGMVGVAVDMGDAYLTKTRVQNALDAAALSAAKTLMEGASTTESSAAAQQTYNANLAGHITQSASPTVSYSTSLKPFVAGAVEPDARYVRVSLQNLTFNNSLIRVIPGVGNTTSISGSAVAGPSPPLGPTVCNLAPLVFCGDSSDTDCSDGHCFGYPVNAEVEQVLKSCPEKGNGNNSGNNNNGGACTSEVGPGNFQLIQLDCGAGSDCVRENLAGSYSGCATMNQSVTTKPGNSVGPVAQGLNTRFGEYLGGMSSSQHPPDTVTFNNAGSFWYSDYLNRQNGGNYDYTPVASGGIGVPKRRVMPVPIGNCSGTTNGTGTVPVIGIGCFFLTRPAPKSGKEQAIMGQLVTECAAGGQIDTNSGGGGTAGSNLFRIILYNDPDREDA